jgi:hypothetical protein
MAQASSTGSNPNVINSLRQAVNRDQRFVEPILNRQASNIEGILNSGAFSNLRGTLASGNQTQIGTNALKVTRLPLFESLALELAGSGFETYGITGGFSLSFITGIDFSGGEYTHRDPDSRQVISKKNISSVGPSFGLQLGGAVPIQMCWFKDEPENLGGWCRVAVVGGFSPLILPLAVVFYYQLEDSSSSSLIGMGIMGGPGIEISFATGWCFSWVH